MNLNRYVLLLFQQCLKIEITISNQQLQIKDIQRIKLNYLDIIAYKQIKARRVETQKNMIQKIVFFFKKDKNKVTQTDDQKDNEEKKEYMPTLFEMWRFYLKFLNLNFKDVLSINLSYITSTLKTIREPFLFLQIQNAILNNDEDALLYLILEFILSELLIQFVEFIDQMMNGQFWRRTYQSVQKSILQHLFSLDIQYFENQKVTIISEITQQGVPQICQELGQGKLMSTINKYTHGFGRIYFVYCLSPMILLMISFICFTFGGVDFYLKKIKENKEKENAKENEFKDFAIDDILNNIILIKTHGTENYEIESINKSIQQNNDSEKKVKFYKQIQNLLYSSSDQIIKLSIILQIFFQLGLPEDIKTIAQSIAQIFDITYSMLDIHLDLFKVIFQIQDDYYEEGKKHIGKVMELFQQKPQIPQDFSNDENDKSQFQGEIIFEKVQFKYPISKDYLAQINQKKKEEERKQDSNSAELHDDQQTQKLKKFTLNSIHSDEIDEDEEEDIKDIKDKNNTINQMELTFQKQDSSQQLILKKSQSSMKERDYVLNNISFKIKKGQFVAFVGTSGSGKSTIVKLILRFYEQNSGQILFDGQNIKDISLNKVRRSIGLVSQEPSLFDNDIEYNITYGCDNGVYTQEELRRVCDMSGVSEFVFDEKRFPKGLKTLVGTNGQKLSGGQKQRIAIARALIKKPKILILDEATSSLDAESEHIVQQYIDKLVGYRGLTIITVAHRLSTIVKSDIIFVMKYGEIREQGSHDELLALNGVYKKLIHHQINFEQNNSK